jgi:hypothetical protein
MRPISKAIIVSVLGLFLAPLVSAASCSFKTNPATKTDTLLNDCETSSTITVNDGFTLDGKGHVITAILDPSGSFSGAAVITNVSGANTMFVKNVIVDFGYVGCVVPQGIAFTSVAGSITASSVLHAGPSCGSSVIAIYVDDVSGVSRTVTVSTNKLLLANTGLQIDATSGMTVHVTGNEISAAVPLRVGGAGGTISSNTFEATSEAVILNGAPVKLFSNNINLVSGSGVSIGIDAASNNNTISGNRVFNYASINTTGVGISNTGTGNAITKNIFRCYATTISGPSGTGNVVLPCPWAACPAGTSEQVFGTTMHGCPGKVPISNRASLCAVGWHVCAAAEWNAMRGSTAPAHNYWTEDILYYVSGSSNSCMVSRTLQNPCTNASMLVCVNGGTDPEGNTCNIFGCGLDILTVQFFGGCPNPGNTAGALCCHP